MKCKIEGMPYNIPLKFFLIKHSSKELYFECKICGKTDLSRKTLKWHMKAIHEEILEAI